MLIGQVKEEGCVHVVQGWLFFVLRPRSELQASISQYDALPSSRLCNWLDVSLAVAGTAMCHQTPLQGRPFCPSCRKFCPHPAFSCQPLPELPRLQRTFSFKVMSPCPITGQRRSNKGSATSAQPGRALKSHSSSRAPQGAN